MRLGDDRSSYKRVLETFSSIAIESLPIIRLMCSAASSTRFLAAAISLPRGSRAVPAYPVLQGHRHDVHSAGMFGHGHLSSKGLRRLGRL